MVEVSTHKQSACCCFLSQAHLPLSQSSSCGSVIPQGFCFSPREANPRRLPKSESDCHISSGSNLVVVVLVVVVRPALFLRLCDCVRSGNVVVLQEFVSLHKASTYERGDCDFEPCTQIKKQIQVSLMQVSEFRISYQLLQMAKEKCDYKYYCTCVCTSVTIYIEFLTHIQSPA